MRRQAAMRVVLDGGSPQVVTKGEVSVVRATLHERCYVILGGTIKLSRVLVPRASAIISIHKPQSIMEGDALNADVIPRQRKPSLKRVSPALTRHGCGI